MNFLSPEYLFFLWLVPLVLALYLLMLRRRKRSTVRYSSLSLVRAAMPRYSRLRRHLPFALLLLGMTSLIFTLSRPVHAVDVPSGQATIMLVLDVSASMTQNDVAPSRIEAAKSAALTFIDNQAEGTRIGITAFAGIAQLVQAPTSDRAALEYAIDSLTTARGTAIGSGLLTALDAIAAIDPNVAPVSGDAAAAATPVPQGTYAPHIIVLLTDGVSSTGPDPVEAAQEAADRGIKVYTIGFGTANGGGIGGGGFNGRGGGNQQGGFRRGIDEAALQQIAAVTDGKYYAASSANELLKVFADLPTYLFMLTEKMEISVLFAAIGTVLAGVAIALSLRWQPLS